MKILTFDIEHSSGIFRPWLPGFVLSCLSYKFTNEYLSETNTLWFDHNELPFDPGFFSSSWATFQHYVNEADIIVGQNIKHDIIISRFCGNVDFANKKLWDTMNTEYLIAGQSPERSYNLEAILEFRGMPEKHTGINDYWDNGISTENIPWEIVKDRVESDVALTEELYKAQFAEIENDKLLKVVELQNEFQHSLVDMELNGLLIDVDRGHQIYTEEKKIVESLTAELKELFGCSELNLASNDQLSAVLYGGKCEVSWKEWVYKPLKHKPETKYYEKKIVKVVEFPGVFDPPKKGKTKKEGVYRTDKTTLSQLKAKGKLGRIVKLKLTELSEHTKVMETLIGKGEDAGLLNKIASDGKLHTIFNTAFTKTGRLSSKNPNGQNFPRGNTSPIKQIIIPYFDYILQWDLSQIEWRGAAWLSQDGVMIVEINSGIDQHAAACKDIMQLKFVDKSDPESKANRDHAKVFNFRMIYGGSFWGFFLDPKMPRFSKKRWQEIVEAFFNKYFELKIWQDKNIHHVWTNNGLLIIPTGRRFQFVKTDYEEGVPVYPENCIKNYPVQGIAGGDILPLACVIIRRGMRNLGLKSKLILTVHDSIVFDVIKKEMRKLLILLEKITANLPKYISSYFDIDWNVDLDGECEYGVNYGELEKINSTMLGGIND